MPEQTLADRLERLINAQEDIDTAVIEKGGTVTKGLENSDDDINTIPITTTGHTVKITSIPNAVVAMTDGVNTYTKTVGVSGVVTFEGIPVGTYTITSIYDDAESDSTSITISDHIATEDSFATLTISASANTTITVTDGAVTKTLEYTGTPIVQYVSLGTWDLSCTIDDTVVTRTVQVSTYTNQNINLAPPSTEIIRVIDFVNNTTSIEGDVSTHPVYSNIKRCNVGDDGTINAYDGDVGYVEDGKNGQVLVKIPKFYYSLDVSNTGDLDGVKIRKGKWGISDTPKEGYELHPAFIAADGVTELDYFLYGAFDAVGQDSNGTYSRSYNTTTYKLGSVGGNLYSPSNTFTRATARTMATNRGVGWYQVGIKQHMAVLMLFMVEKGANSQNAVGYGIVSDSAAHKTGQTVGSITSGTKDNKTTPVNWRGIENLWGNIYNWIDGINLNGTTAYVCNNFSYIDDTSTGYTQIGFTIAGGGQWITAFGYDPNNKWILLPTETNSSGSGDDTIGDRCWTGSGWCVCGVGGSWGYGLDAGAFCFALGSASSVAHSTRGSRLMYIPQ